MANLLCAGRRCSERNNDDDLIYDGFDGMPNWKKTCCVKVTIELRETSK